MAIRVTNNDGTSAMQGVKSVTIGAVVTRADGTVEDHGLVAYHHSNPLRRWLMNSMDPVNRAKHKDTPTWAVLVGRATGLFAVPYALILMPAIKKESGKTRAQILQLCGWLGFVTMLVIGGWVLLAVSWLLYHLIAHLFGVS